MERGTSGARPDRERRAARSDKHGPEHNMRSTGWRRLARLFNPGVISLCLILAGFAGGLMVLKKVHDHIQGYAGINPTVIKVRKHLLNMVDQPRLAFEYHTSHSDG